jgi:hypothetical protein
MILEKTSLKAKDIELLKSINSKENQVILMAILTGIHTTSSCALISTGSVCLAAAGIDLRI